MYIVSFLRDVWSLRQHIRIAAVMGIALPLTALVGCSCSVGISQKQGAYAECHTSFDPPANSLTNIDTTQAFAALTTQNGTVNNSTGTFTIKVTDTASGTLLGQHSFSYVMSGNSLYAQNPTSVHSWLDGFTQYGSEEVTVKISASDIDFVPTIQSGTASLGVAAKYQGFTYAAATLNEEIHPTCPKGLTCQPK